MHIGVCFLSNCFQIYSGEVTVVPVLVLCMPTSPEAQQFASWCTPQYKDVRVVYFVPFPIGLEPKS